MKAVLMAGGEGTRLRPLTSNQPKPMVPIVGKPCIEHILELLREHGLTNVVITLAFLPQAIRSYFGDGSGLGMDVEYSVEESPLGTAGSVRLATQGLQIDDTFLVISGDALCDIDLTALIAYHREQNASVTMIPNSSGFSTDLSPIVTAAPFSLCVATICCRSMSQSASPEMTRKVSSSRWLASRTEPAVPSGLSSTEYSTSMPSPDPSPK